MDFDSLYGHRRDPAGYAVALETLDRCLPALFSQLCDNDIAIITADHGNDPTWEGTDHTREQVPVLLFGPGIQARSIGQRDSLADIGQTIAEHLGLMPLDYGHSFLEQCLNVHD